MSLDRRAVKILTQTFWSSAGWHAKPQTAPDDFAYAKSKGLMFDPLDQTHDQLIEAVVEATACTRKRDVARAFVASLRSRRLDLRSALGSYAVSRNLPVHAVGPSDVGKRCSCCGDYGGMHQVDLNILNFERIKWGGVRHDQPAYIALDLKQFGRTVVPEVDTADWATLLHVLDTARAIPSKGRLGHLDKALGSVLPSNSAERRTLISILGFTGILIDPSRPDFRRGFVPANERERTHWHTDDWPYPVQWWTGSCGVNDEAVLDWFPELA